MSNRKRRSRRNCNRRRHYTKESSRKLQSLKIKSNGNAKPNITIDCTKLLSLSLNQEKKPKLGEDANPLLITEANSGFIGVFDGMGGSGATEYTLPDGTKHTGAYLASRLVLEQMKSFIKSNYYYDIDSTNLEKHLKEQLNVFAAKMNIKNSGLRSSIIRILPTTLSVIGYLLEGNNKIDIYSYWCGDSRNYILTDKGLKQISIDDIKSKQDPLENLRNDDALSNCICQDHPFTINKFHLDNKELPIILLSATDGCFGYLPSPMHFENILLETLMNSTNAEEWKNNIIETLKPISGDDFSMSIVMIGLSFEEWKEHLSNRYKDVKNKYINKITEIQQKIEIAKREVVKNEQRLFDDTTNLWNEYKSNYLILQ